MTELHPGEDLLEEPPGPFLCQLSVLDDVVEQLSARDVLHDHEDVGRGGDDLVQLDDVWVTEQLEVLDLSSDLADHVEALDLLSVQDFDGHFVPRYLVEPDCKTRRLTLL